MTHWDGLTTDRHSRIVVLGATNRPNDIDDAVLRRLPKRFPIERPNATQRLKILQLLLKNAHLRPGFSYDRLVDATQGQSGSDIRELCRNAAIKPIREYIRDNAINVHSAVQAGVNLRPLTEQDVTWPITFLTLLTCFKSSQPAIQISSRQKICC